jgi:hypothetical protein
MQGKDQQTGSAFGTTDWLNKASPDDIVKNTVAGVARIGQLDANYRDQFIEQLRAEPTAARLLEQMGSVTS